MNRFPVPSQAVLVRAIFLPLSILVLCQCTAPVSVHTVKPPTPAGVVRGPSKPAQRIDAIRQAYERIVNGDPSALATYNYQTARLLDDLEKSAVPWTAPLMLDEVKVTCSLRTVFPTDVSPEDFQLLPADSLEFSGKYANEQSLTAGIGAPLVAVKSFKGIGRRGFRKDLPIRNLTAVVTFQGAVATLELLDPYQTQKVHIGGREMPLAADYGASTMLALSKTRVDKLGIVRLIWPDRYADTSQLSFLQPYDPGRIPVLMVHGLDSTPATFAPLYFKLIENPEIRKRYQFWVYSYPSGYPYPYCAGLLRKQLDAVHEEFPKNKEIVLIGHSMGTLISRLMVTDVGEQLWMETFGKSVTETRIPGASRKELERTLVFRNRPEIRKVIFISGPHRGSDLANNWFGHFISKLIRLPATVADLRDTLISAATLDAAALELADPPDSIETLSPVDPFVLAINKIPIAPGVTYHSIMGDRGKGDTPESSDGVVPYWSSHLNGAASEKIVPSGHGAHQNPEGMAEVERILLEKAR